jgi:hypothetical protein
MLYKHTAISYYGPKHPLLFINIYRQNGAQYQSHRQWHLTDGRCQNRHRVANNLQLVNKYNSLLDVQSLQKLIRLLQSFFRCHAAETQSYLLLIVAIKTAKIIQKVQTAKKYILALMVHVMKIYVLLHESIG